MTTEISKAAQWALKGLEAARAGKPYDDMEKVPARWRQDWSDGYIRAAIDKPKSKTGKFVRKPLPSEEE